MVQELLPSLKPRLAAVLLLLLAGCTAPVRQNPQPQSDTYGNAPVLPPDVPVREYPKTAAEISGPAVQSLLQQADAQQQAGHNDQAVAILERAMRLEPRNPFVWQALAQAHLDQNADQAEAEAQKSNSLARGNPYIESGNWKLIADARSARGDAAGASQARTRMDEINRRIH